MKSNECITLSTFKILPVQLSIKKLNISKKVCLLSNMSTNTFCQLFLHWLSFMKKIVICRLFKYRPRLTEYKWLQIEICIILSNLFFHFFVYILFSFCMLWSKFQTFSHLKFVIREYMTKFNINMHILYISKYTPFITRLFTIHVGKV